MAGEIKKVLFSEGVSVAEPEDVDLASGSGEKNYISNPSANGAITGWTSVNDLDVARTTTAGDLPREYTTASGIKITADSNTQSTADYVYYDFTLDDVDLSKKLKIQWAQKTTGTYTAGDLAVVITTQADRTTALHTPITTAIPAVDGVFTTYFDASTTATLSLVIRATTDMTTDGGIVISDVVVGPGVGVQGAVVSEWKTFTSDPAPGNFGTVANTSWRYRRIGDSAHIKGAFQMGIRQASTAAIALPTGMTLSASATPASAARNLVGHWYASGGGSPTIVTASAQGALHIDPAANTTNIYFAHAVADGTGFGKNNGTNIGGANSEYVAVDFTVPIAEWAGSGTVNLAQNDVEYASNSDDTATASVTASGFQYGPNGAPFSSNWAIGTSYTRGIQFQTAIQPTDRFEVEVSEDSGVTWLPASDGGGNICSSMMVQGTSYYGVQVRSLSSTAVKVIFYANGRSPSNATYAGNGAAWSTLSGGVNRWRVRKISGGQAVGFGIASAGSSGLIPYYYAYTAPSAACTGAITTSAIWKLTRVGNLVTLTLPITTGTATAVTSFTFGEVLPSQFRPLENLTQVVDVRDNGARTTQVGMVFITASTGAIQVYRSTNATTAFTNAASAGINESKSISWII